MPTTTQNSCWDTLSSIFCCCYKDEQSNISSFQINTAIASPSSSVAQINNFTPTNRSNNNSSSLNISNLTSPNNFQELATLSVNQESMQATEPSRYNHTQESSNTVHTFLNMIILYDVNYPVFLRRGINHQLFFEDTQAYWANPENVATQMGHIRNSQHHWEHLISSSANDIVYPHQIESIDISS